MRAVTVCLALAGSALWAACNTDASLGDRIKPRATVASGGSCSQNSDCSSGLCLGQACCALASCGTDLTCQATACDATGACVYPVGSCGSPACSASQLTESACALGACVAGAPSACPGNLTCADAISCRVSCRETSDCVNGFYCSNGSCASQLAAGSGCQSNDACTSGICGVAGTGHCCTATCSTSDPYGCGATDCDSTGACAYPSTTTSCIAQSCTGHTLTEAGNCNGAGACPITQVDCTPYACGANAACKTNCSVAADCSNAFCSSATSVCCAFYPANTIQVDGSNGVDQACCGSGTGTKGCATIAYAATLAADTSVMPTTLAVANAPNGNDWTADQFPITLAEGLILSAPGLYFSASLPDGGPGYLLFGSNPSSVLKPTPTVLEGSAASPIHVGFDSQGSTTSAWAAVGVGHATVNLLNAEIRSNRFGIRMGTSSSSPFSPSPDSADATLTLGNDGLGNSGTVWIGNPDAGPFYGIFCDATAGLINDTGSTVAPSVWIQKVYQGIYADWGCNLSLTDSPRFGPAPGDAGLCDPWMDPAGVGVSVAEFPGAGVPAAVINNATFQCSQIGLATGFLSSGDNDLFQFNIIGAALWGGTLDGGQKLSDSTFRNNATALYAGGVFDLSKGNKISCNDWLYNEPGYGGVGLRLWSSGVGVNAENILWDRWDPDAGHTQTWTCSYVQDFDAGRSYVNYSSGCTCSGDPDCPQSPSALPSKVDILVELWPGLTAPPVDDANGSQAADGCP